MSGKAFEHGTKTIQHSLLGRWNNKHMWKLFNETTQKSPEQLLVGASDSHVPLLKPRELYLVFGKDFAYLVKSGEKGLKQLIYIYIFNASPIILGSASGLKSGLCPGCRCRPMQNHHSCCIVFNTMIGNFLKSCYFSNSSGSFVMVNFLKLKPQPVISQTQSGSSVTNNFPKPQLVEG